MPSECDLIEPGVSYEVPGKLTITCIDYPQTDVLSSLFGGCDLTRQIFDVVMIVVRWLLHFIFVKG